MSEIKLGEVCEHGSLKRQCEICERDAEIARLSKAYEEHSSVVAWQKLAIENREAENSRLRNALEKYADPNAWRTVDALADERIPWKWAKEALASSPKEVK